MVGPDGPGRCRAASVGGVSSAREPNFRASPVEAARPGGRGAPDGSFNFRDIGASGPGRRSGLRAGAVFRSGSLDGLSRRGWRQLVDLGVATIFDLRTGAERDAEPTVVPPELSLRIVSLPMWATSGSGTITATPEVFATRAAAVATSATRSPGSSGAGSDGDVPNVDARADHRANEALSSYIAAKESAYGSIAALHQPTLARLVSELGTPGAVPCLIHCSAGKDRTGIAAAVLLRLAGTSCKYVVADYLASRRAPSERRLERYLPHLSRLGVPLEQFLRPYGAHVPALATAFAVMESRGGAVAGYLRQGGLTAEAAERALRAIA